MTRPDDVMERVLGGLRDVKAPVGMERRILDRLESSAAARGRVGWRRLWLVGMVRPGVAVAFGVGVAALIVCVLGISVVHRVGRAPVRAKLNSTGRREDTALRARVPVAKPRVSIERFAVRVDAVKEETGARFESDVDSVAMSEMRASSFPAPPMPLTEQERLLVRMVHRGDGVELAMLDPKMEALRDAEEKAEFQRFFAKPVVKESGGDGSGQIETVSPVEPAGTTEQMAPSQADPDKSGPTLSSPEQSTTREGTRQEVTTGERQ